MTQDHQLEPAERAEILAEWERLRAEPRPRARPPYGCATVLIATVLSLLVWQVPRLAGWAPPSSLQSAVLAILALLIAGGLLFHLFAGSGKFAHDCLRASEAIEWLAANPGTSDAAARRRHAVTLLFFAVTADDGPSTSGTFDAGRARTRLGAHLPYVLAAERVLVEERGLWAIFTAPISPSP
jgi:hypothetical protein